MSQRQRCVCPCSSRNGQPVYQGAWKNRSAERRDMGDCDRLKRSNRAGAWRIWRNCDRRECLGRKEGYTGAIAIGPDSVAQQNSIALGRNTNASALSVAVGMFANAVNNSVALGDHSVADRPNTVSVG